jgi:hypothetical protein
MATRVRQAVAWIVVGGSAFWLPVIVAWAILPDSANDKVSLISLNGAPVIGLLLLPLIRRLRHQSPPRWDWILAGVYILGPTATMIALYAHQPWDSLTVPWQLIAMCLFPPATLWFATYSQTFLAVVAVSAVAVFIFAYREIQASRAQARKEPRKAA